MKPVIVCGLLGAALFAATSSGCTPAKQTRPSKMTQATLESVLRARGTAQSNLAYINKLDTMLQELWMASLQGADVVETARVLGLHVSDGKNVLVDVYVITPVDEAAAQLRQLGMDIRATNESARVVEGPLPINQLEAAAWLESTRAIIGVSAFGVDRYR